jgi:hypothetical protein
MLVGSAKAMTCQKSLLNRYLSLNVISRKIHLFFLLLTYCQIAVFSVFLEHLLDLAPPLVSSFVVLVELEVPVIARLGDHVPLQQHTFKPQVLHRHYVFETKLTNPSLRWATSLLLWRLTL